MTTSSHAAAQVSESPTFAQLKALFSQIDKGNITKKELQRFLRKPKKSSDLQTLLDALAEHIVMWRQRFKGKEEALAIRLMPFMNGAKPLTLQKPHKARWAAYRKSIFWQVVSGVQFIGQRDVLYDYPSFSIETNFADSIIETYTNCDSMESITLGNEEHEFFLLHDKLLCDNCEDRCVANWNLPDALMKNRYQWFDNGDMAPFSSIMMMLDDLFCHTLNMVALLLMSNQHEEEAFLLLEMWGCGNYPLGFDKNDQLIVLCA